MKAAENFKLQTSNAKLQTVGAAAVIETLAFEVWRLKFGVLFLPSSDPRSL